MLFLITLFLIISPSIILYTMGYRYDLKEGLVRQVGSLSVDIEPRDVTIMLDDVFLTDRSPIRLTNLTPGTYHLSLTKDGHHNWEKDITIESKQTFYIKDIEMQVAESPIEVEHIPHDVLPSLTFSHDGTHALYTTEQDAIFEVILYNTQTEEKETILRTQSTSPPQLSWSPYASHGAIITEQNAEKNIFLFSTQNTVDHTSFSLATDADTENIQWSTKATSPELYVKNTNIILQLNLDEQTTAGVTEHTIWYVDQKDTLWTFDNEKKRLTHYDNNEPLTYNIDEPIRSIIRIEDGHALLLSDNHLFVWYIDEMEIYKNHTLDTPEITYNHLTDSWLAWSPWELWEITNAGEISLLNRSSEHTHSAFPLDELGDVLVQKDATLQSFNPRYDVAQTLASKEGITMIGVDSSEKQLFFVTAEDKKNSALWRLLY